jgi:type I restriction enzyme S subunit
MSVKALAEVADIIMGQSPEGSSYNTLNQGYPLLAGAGDFGEDTPKAKKFTNAANKLCKIGDIILCIRATIGDLNWADKEYCLGRGVAGIRPKSSQVDSKYLWFALAAQKQQLQSKGTGSTFKQVSRDDITDLKLFIPSLSEQRRIAAILDKADAIRRKRRQAIDLMNDFLRSVFLEMFGDPENNPRKWNLFRLADVIDHFEGGKSFKSPEDDNVEGKTRILKISAISWGEFNPSESKPVPDTYVPPKHHFVRQGDLLISRANTSELVGAVSYVFDPPPPVLLPDKLWRFVFRKDTQIRPLYLLVLFQQQAIRNELARLGTGTSGSMKNISMGKLMNMQIPVPDLKTQDKFEVLFLKYRQVITAMNRKISLANELSSSLQNDLFGSELANEI